MSMLRSIYLLSTFCRYLGTKSKDVYIISDEMYAGILAAFCFPLHFAKLLRVIVLQTLGTFTDWNEAKPNLLKYFLFLFK